MRCNRVHNPEDVDLTGLDRTFAAWAEALSAGDPEALADLLTPDAEFWTHGEAPLRGMKAASEAFTAVFRSYDAEQAFDCAELFVSPDWALARGTEHNRLRPKSGGEPIVVRQRAFTLLRRGDDGVWRFACGMTNLGAA